MTPDKIPGPLTPPLLQRAEEKNPLIFRFIYTNISVLERLILFICPLEPDNLNGKLSLNLLDRHMDSNIVIYLRIFYQIEVVGRDSETQL